MKRGSPPSTDCLFIIILALSNNLRETAGALGDCFVKVLMTFLDLKQGERPPEGIPCSNKPILYSLYSCQ